MNAAPGEAVLVGLIEKHTSAPTLLTACELAYEMLKWVPGNGKPGTLPTRVDDLVVDAIAREKGGAS